jgi:hypothetical protein
LNSSLRSLSMFVVLFHILSGCGVKSAPVPPPGTELPSYIHYFLNPDSEENETEE